MTTITKKISVSTVFGRISAERVGELKKTGEWFRVGRFFGVATGSKTGVSQFGPWTALTGTFRGINAETGEVFEGSQLLLPMGLAEAAAVQLNDGAASLSLAFDIKIKHREIAGSDKYEYSAEAVDVGGVKIPSPLDALAASFADKPLAIENKAETHKIEAEKKKAK